MIRQLFASAGGVSEERRTTGAAPFSVVLHAAAIGGLLFFSSQKVASTDVRPTVPVYHAESTPTPVPTQEVVVALNPQVRGAQRPAAPQKQPLPNVPTATPFVEPNVISDSVQADDTPPNEALAPYVAPGCANCTDTGGPASVGPGSETGPVATENIIRLPETEAPRKTRDVAPTYPEIMRRARLSGVVYIECVIAPDGHVRDTRLVAGNPIFAASALEAVRQWIYTPSKYNGKPVSVVMTVTVRFVLR